MTLKLFKTRKNLHVCNVTCKLLNAYIPYKYQTYFSTPNMPKKYLLQHPIQNHEYHQHWRLFDRRIKRVHPRQHRRPQHSVHEAAVRRPHAGGHDGSRQHDHQIAGDVSEGGLRVPGGRGRGRAPLHRLQQARAIGRRRRVVSDEIEVSRNLMDARLRSTEVVFFFASPIFVFVFKQFWNACNCFDQQLKYFINDYIAYCRI